MPSSVVISAPSRLHFGLLSFGQASGRQFGGVGVMVDAPGCVVRLTRHERWEGEGPHAERALAIAQRVAAELVNSKAAQYAGPCRIVIERAPRLHTGLGTGTQLALAVTAGLRALGGLPPADAETLARQSGRGLRSAVGTHGFLHGGLIVESGKCGADELGALTCHAALPAEWRWVLATPSVAPGSAGLAGDAEQQAFAALPAVPRETSAELCRLALLEIAPAALSGDFDGFSHAIYDYGLLAGGCFAARQGGPFASPELAALVAAARDFGAEGTGQTSWGPTIFSLLPDEESARIFAERLAQHPAARRLEPEIVIATTSPHGATIAAD